MWGLRRNDIARRFAKRNGNSAFGDNLVNLLAAGTHLRIIIPGPNPVLNNFAKKGKVSILSSACD
jgi:hypothetical protein